VGSIEMNCRRDDEPSNTVLAELAGPWRRVLLIGGNGLKVREHPARVFAQRSSAAMTAARFGHDRSGGGQQECQQQETQRMDDLSTHSAVTLIQIILICN